MAKNGLLIQNRLPSKKRSQCEKLSVCHQELMNQKGKIQGMDRQMKNLLIQMGQQKKGKKMALKDFHKRESLIARC